MNGMLYGTTAYGGAYGEGSGGGGTVFSLAPNGTETVLHSFGNGNDGLEPRSNLIDVKGTLYGTTFQGGRYASGGAGGTVFNITTGGTERILHSFGNGDDGLDPKGGLIEVNDTLYGTTSEGGPSDNGIVYATTRGGTEHIVHDFVKLREGVGPVGSLIDIQGKLYGTTYQGGKYGNGGGTMFDVVTNLPHEAL